MSERHVKIWASDHSFLSFYFCVCPSSILWTWLSESLELQANCNWCKESFCYTRPHPILRPGSWPLCMITSDKQISTPSLICKENFLHLHSLCVGILFKFTTSGILLCKTSQLNFKTRLGGEICSFDVNTRKGYFLGTPPIIICTCTAVYSHEAHFHMLIPCYLF